MTIGRSQAERDMTTLLSKTLVQKEVLEPLDKIGWGHGTPPPPDHTSPEAGQPTSGGSTTAGETKPGAQSGQPAKPTEGNVAAPAKADATSIEAAMAAFESTKDPVSGLYGGKYKTVEEAIKGGRHLAQMANGAFSDRDKMAEKLAAVEAENLKLRQTPAPQAAPVTSPRQSVSRTAVDAAQVAYDKVLSDIVEEGGMLDAEAAKRLSKAERELRQAEVDFRVQESFQSRDSAEDAENRQWDAVSEYMGKNHPDADKFSDEVALFVRGNTPLAKAVDSLRKAGDLIAATELAWTSYRDASGAKVTAEKTAADVAREEDLAAREEVRADVKANALKDAGVVLGSVGGSGVHQGGPNRGTPEERAALIAQAQIEGMAPGSASAKRLREMIIPLPF